MDKKANIGKGAIFLIGVIYSILGGLFLVIGLPIYIMVNSEGRIAGIILAGIGLIFFIIGIVFLVYHHRKQQSADALLIKNQYIIGEVVDFVHNSNVQMKGRFPFVVLVAYTDFAGDKHIFKSRNVFNYPDKSILGKQVKIYIDDDTYNNYYVDIDSVLPTIIEH